MNNTKDYYKILGVDKNENIDKIKKTYKSLAMQYHPDRTCGDKEKESLFKEIQEAYDTLSDENKREMYDLEQNGIDFINPADLFRNFNNMGHRPHVVEINSFGDFGGVDILNDLLFSELFNTTREFDIFSTRQQQQSSSSLYRQSRKKEEHYEIYLSLNDIVFGTDKLLNLKTGNSSFVEKKITIHPNIKHNDLIEIEYDNIIHKIKCVHNYDDNIKIKKNDIVYYCYISIVDLLCGFKKNVNILDIQKTLESKKCFDYTKNIIIPKKGLFIDKNNTNIRGDFVIKFKIKNNPDDITMLSKYHRLFRKIFNT